MTLVPETAAPVPTPSPTPVPSPTPAPTPEPTPSPTPTPEPTPYKSADYPLPPKSLRTREGGRYPEEARLNENPDHFYTVVDLTNQAVFVYEKDSAGEYTVLVREMICSSGIEDGHRSPRGTFKMGEDYKAASLSSCTLIVMRNIGPRSAGGSTSIPCLIPNGMTAT